jgi:hypothetical protein
MMNRQERIQDLKQRMVAKYGDCLVPLDAASFPVLQKDDTPKEREEKLLKRKQILEAREAAHKLKVPEMLVELDKIVTRIKQTKSEQTKSTRAAVEGIHSTSTAALSLLTIACEQCGNRVS